MNEIAGTIIIAYFEEISKEDQNA